MFYHRRLLLALILYWLIEFRDVSVDQIALINFVTVDGTLLLETDLTLDAQFLVRILASILTNCCVAHAVFRYDSATFVTCSYAIFALLIHDLRRSLLLQHVVGCLISLILQTRLGELLAGCVLSDVGFNGDG